MYPEDGGMIALCQEVGIQILPTQLIVETMEIIIITFGWCKRVPR